MWVDPGTGQFEQAPRLSEAELEKAPADDLKFVDFVAGDVDLTWKQLADSGKTYEQPIVVLYDSQVSTACGNAPSTVGPFYCPRDHKVYLDLPFMEQLQQRLGAKGDFAQAYIIAHEIGHHVQNLLGVMDDVNLAQQESPDDANDLSVRLELQADCLAGIWAHSAVRQEDLLETGGPRGGADRRRGRRRRPDPEAGRRRGQPGHVCARQRRAAGGLVQEGLPERRPRAAATPRATSSRGPQAGWPRSGWPAHVRRLSRARVGGSDRRLDGRSSRRGASRSRRHRGSGTRRRSGRPRSPAAWEKLVK